MKKILAAFFTLCGNELENLNDKFPSKFED